MAAAASKKSCCRCNKPKNTVKCEGCSKDFCFDHISEHRNELSQLLGETEDRCNEIKNRLEELQTESQQHELMKQIDEWECESIKKIQQLAQDMRGELSSAINSIVVDLNLKLKNLAQEIVRCRSENDFADLEIEHFNEKLYQLKSSLSPETYFDIRENSTSLINRIYLSTKITSANCVSLNADTKWTQNGITVAGGNDAGGDLNQLSNLWGLCIDDDQTLYIADCNNHRVVQWTCGATRGQIVAGGNGKGNRLDQLNNPTAVTIDLQRNSLIVCDFGNRRVVRWPYKSDTPVETIVTDIACFGSALDHDGLLYIADYENHAIKRYSARDSQGKIVAGGKGPGNQVDQLSGPRYLFVDRDKSIYVGDCGNHRIVKWMRDATQGIVVAGGNGAGNGLRNFLSPYGIVVDRWGIIYVADSGNNRIVRWLPNATQGSVIIGQDSEGNQFNQPRGLVMDREGSIYVSDYKNSRVQKFKVNRLS